jgi:Raf kinase inhibitor-like YbhB/YbcL family protein
MHPRFQLSGLGTSPSSLAQITCALALLISVASCGNPTLNQKVSGTLSLSSSSISGGMLASNNSCDGHDVSPELSWSAPPSGTKSFALLVIDRDTIFGSIVGDFVHWTIFNIPADERKLPAAMPTQGQLSDGSLQGETDFDKIGYGGPCPHGKSPHRYVFTLYALDTKLSLPAWSSAKQIMLAMDGHILAKGEITGSYRRH